MEREHATTAGALRLGVDLGGTKIEAALLEASTRIIARARRATPKDDYYATLKVIDELCAALERDAGVPEPLPLGIGTPGSVSPTTGLMRNCNSTALNGQSLAKDLAALTGRAVRIANDADCFTLSEAFDGAGADAHCVFGVILGTGVGGGVCIDGRLLSGPNRIAGEWGHNRLALERVTDLPEACRTSRLCYCGRWDCVESWLSGPGIALLHEQLHKAPVAVQELNSASPDTPHRQTLSVYHRMLATGLAEIVNVLDPHTIVLGGGLSNLPSLYAAVPALMATRVFSDSYRTELKPAAHGDSSGVRGAAWLWAETGAARMQSPWG